MFPFLDSLEVKTNVVDLLKFEIEIELNSRGERQFNLFILFWLDTSALEFLDSFIFLFFKEVC
jgi:hypothetical protein